MVALEKLWCVSSATMNYLSIAMNYPSVTMNYLSIAMNYPSVTINYSSVTMNYPSAVFFHVGTILLKIILRRKKKKLRFRFYVGNAWEYIDGLLQSV